MLVLHSHHKFLADNYANQVSDSIIDGRNLQVSFANDSQVYGRDNSLNHVLNVDSRVHGQDRVSYLTNGHSLNGDSQTIRFTMLMYPVMVIA